MPEIFSQVKVADLDLLQFGITCGVPCPSSRKNFSGECC